MSSESADPIRVGVVGLGYWGPNLARNLAAIPGCELAWLCDPSEPARERLARFWTVARGRIPLWNCGWGGFPVL